MLYGSRKGILYLYTYHVLFFLDLTNAAMATKREASMYTLEWKGEEHTSR